MGIDFKEILTAFMVLFAVIDITGSVPVIIDLRSRSKKVHAEKAAIISFLIMLIFLFVGEAVLNFFHVDVHSFAIAGAIILIAIAIEMTFNVELFKNEGASENSTIVPLVFPLIAGAGALTTVLSLRAECETINIIIAIVLNMLFVWFVIKKVNWVERILGKGGIYILRKFFGVILLAMSVKLIISNLIPLIS